MAWFLALQGPAHMTNQSTVYELQDAVDVHQIAEELASAATIDRVVPVPAVLTHNRRHQKVTLYVRPAAWGVWTFYQLSEEERRKLVAENPLMQALTQAARQQGQQNRGADMGPGIPYRLGPS